MPLKPKTALPIMVVHSKTMASYDQLPPEVLQYILLNLSYRDLMAMSRTSRNINAFCEDERFLGDYAREWKIPVSREELLKQSLRAWYGQFANIRSVPWNCNWNAGRYRYIKYDEFRLRFPSGTHSRMESVFGPGDIHPTPVYVSWYLIDSRAPDRIWELRWDTVSIGIERDELYALRPVFTNSPEDQDLDWDLRQQIRRHPRHIRETVKTSVKTFNTQYTQLKGTIRLLKK